MRERRPQIIQQAEIADLREREEVLEVRARRRLLEAQCRLAQQQLVRDCVETGHRRLALIERFLLLGATLISFALALIGGLSLAAALLVAGGLGGVGLAACGGSR